MTWNSTTPKPWELSGELPCRLRYSQKRKYRPDTVPVSSRKKSRKIKYLLKRLVRLHWTYYWQNRKKKQTNVYGRYFNKSSDLVDHDIRKGSDSKLSISNKLIMKTCWAGPSKPLHIVIDMSDANQCSKPERLAVVKMFHNEFCPLDRTSTSPQQNWLPTINIT